MQELGLSSLGLRNLRTTQVTGGKVGAMESGDSFTLMKGPPKSQASGGLQSQNPGEYAPYLWASTILQLGAVETGSEAGTHIYWVLLDKPQSHAQLASSGDQQQILKGQPFPRGSSSYRRKVGHNQLLSS